MMFIMILCVGKYIQECITTKTKTHNYLRIIKGSSDILRCEGGRFLLPREKENRNGRDLQKSERVKTIKLPTFYHGVRTSYITLHTRYTYDGNSISSGNPENRIRKQIVDDLFQSLVDCLFHLSIKNHKTGVRK